MHPQPHVQVVAQIPPLKEDLKLAVLFGGLSALATAALFPYLLVIVPHMFAKLPMPLWLVIVAQSLQAGVLLTLLSLAGLRLGHRVGLGAPWLRATLFGGERTRQPWLAAIVLGLFSGLLILGLDPLFAPYMPALLHPETPPTTGQASAAAGFLASFYGGIGEEVMLRLFLMTLLVWMQAKLERGRTHALHFWIAIVLAAVLLGVGHLPAAAEIWPLDAVVVARTLVLNGIAGLVFGWLYWKHGIESAMLAHFSADLMLHVLAPLAMG
ncbi:MAG: CPBP family intramembrane glutamic endopeptidase [Arenimonas sp.]|jgi:hypothetical protein